MSSLGHIGSMQNQLVISHNEVMFYTLRNPLNNINKNIAFGLSSDF